MKKRHAINPSTLFLLLLISAVAFPVTSCTVSYSFTGASIDPSVKTFAIGTFPNRAKTYNPTLSEYFTDELRKKLKKQTRLTYQKDAGDLEYEGTITDYDVKALSASDSKTEAQNRLTIKIQVKFTNNKNHEQDSENTFEAYADFSSSENFSDVEDDLVEEIITDIVEDIFNKSVANW